MLRASVIVIVTLGLGLPAAALGDPLPAAGYAFKVPGPCIEDAARAAKPTRPGLAAYQVCADQMALFGTAIAEARATNRLLLVVFGATWCPWCASLQKAMPTAEVLGRKGEALDYGGAFLYLEIGLSMLEKGRRLEIQSGAAVLDFVLARAPATRFRAIPFLAVIDPTDFSRVFARNTDDIATKSGGHDLASFRALLREAHAYLRGNSIPSNEPGWLKRKWQRWWNG